MSEQTSLAIQLNDEEIDILENDYDRYGWIFNCQLCSLLFFICFGILGIDYKVIYFNEYLGYV